MWEETEKKATYHSLVLPFSFFPSLLSLSISISSPRRAADGNELVKEHDSPQKPRQEFKKGGIEVGERGPGRRSEKR